jgi:fructokinase
MPHPRVLCLGEILLDCLADEPAATLAQVKSWTPYPGGAPANVACALQTLGTPSGFIGSVGADQAGADLIELLQKHGVNYGGVQQHPVAPTRMVYVLRSETGDRTFAGFSHPDPTRFADAHLRAERLPIPLFEAAEYLVLGTLELAYPDSQAAIARAIHLAEQCYLKIALDVNWRPMFWPDPERAEPLIRSLMQQVDFLKLSAEEAQWLFGTTDPGAIAGQLDHLEGVLVTFGEDGCAYYLSQQEGYVPAFTVEVVDTTGAGDSFLAGFLHQLCLQGVKNLADATMAREMIIYASAVGALTTTKPGAIAAQPTAAEVATFLAHHRLAEA